MSDKKNQRLGRGLAALIGDYPVQDAKISDPLQGQNTTRPIETSLMKNEADTALSEAVSKMGGIKTALISELRVNPNNPRKIFLEDELSDLARSLSKQGMIQPILVRPIQNDPLARYEIVAGERRWRAAQKAAMHDVPIIVKDVDDKLALEIAIVENVQRTNLNPLEEAEGYGQLIDHFEYTQLELSEVIGKSRAYVTNMLRLLKLPDDVKAYLRAGDLSIGHARALVSADDPSTLAHLIVEDGLSVREAEKLRQQEGEKEMKSALSKLAPKMEKSADIIDLERQLSEILGSVVKLKDKQGKGELKISYGNLDELDYICKRLLGDME